MTTKGDRIYYNCMTADAVRKAGVVVGAVFLKKIMDLKGVSDVYEKISGVDGGCDFIRNSGVRDAIDSWLDEVNSKDGKHREHVDVVRGDLRAWFLAHRDEEQLFRQLEDFNAEAMKQATSEKKKAEMDFIRSKAEEKNGWMDLYDKAVLEGDQETAKKYRTMLIHG